MDQALFTAGRFTAQELERSAPFDPLRRLRGEAGDAFRSTIRRMILDHETRRRARRPNDQARFDATLDALLANFAAAAFNRVDPRRFVAISFDINSYVGLPLSHAALGEIRRALAALDLVEGQAGYRRPGIGAAPAHARRTRLRASPKLRRLFSEMGVGRAEVGWSQHRDIINLKAPDPDLPPEPSDVTASRAVLAAWNKQMATSSLSLPDVAWERIAARYRDHAADPGEEDRPLSGDVTALTLYRGFKGGWDRGGRLYGGWWINVPRVERAHLALEGQPVVELDYARLHPALLFARRGIDLDFDPYLVPGLQGPHVRELGKRTFNRLLNRTPRIGRPDARLRPTPLDMAQLPPGLSFARYLAAFVARLAPISEWFGTGEGVRLQREDSDLAIAVLDRLLREGILALPVHDSFIVQTAQEGALRSAMTAAFAERYGFTARIRSAQTPARSRRETVHN